MRLIDADMLIKKLESNSWTIDEWELPHEQVTAGLEANAMDRETVEGMPTIDAVPVRHGKWITEWETEDTRMLRCSECRMVFNVGNGRDGNYCPNCGARMDEERKEE